MPEPEPRISYVIARLERAVRHGINQRLKPHGLTTLQYTTLSVLNTLGGRAGLSNAQLARRSYMTPQSMNEVIEALERKGLIVRNPHPSHRRVYPAMLTPAGRTVLAKCDVAVDELESQMLAGLTPSKVVALRSSIVSAVRALGAGFPAG
jgi:DNA-binding MarR family transcriptional regulator